MTQPVDSSMYGAVDLAPLAETSAHPHEAGASAQGVVEGPIAIDVTAENLREIIERSATVPIILFFTTARVPEAASLASTFEQTAQAYAGRFQFGRVDVDTQMAVAQEFRLQGVPAAVAVLQRRPFPLFEGVAQTSDIAPLLDQVLQAATSAGITGRMSGGHAPVEAPLPPHMKEAYEALDAGDLAKAKHEFELALKANPSLDEAKVGLAHVELAQRTDARDPQEILAAVKDIPLTDIAAHMEAADIEVRYGHPDAAFARLIDVIKATTGEDRETVRKRILDLFEIVGAGTVVTQARRALANALF